MLFLQTSDIFLSLKRGEGSNGNKLQDDTSALHTTLSYLARSCLIATPKVDVASLSSALNMCTSLSEEAIRGIAGGFERVAEVAVNQSDHTSHVSSVKQAAGMQGFIVFLAEYM